MQNRTHPFGALPGEDAKLGGRRSGIDHEHPAALAGHNKSPLDQNWTRTSLPRSPPAGAVLSNTRPRRGVRQPPPPRDSSFSGSQYRNIRSILTFFHRKENA